MLPNLEAERPTQEPDFVYEGGYLDHGIDGMTSMTLIGLAKELRYAWMQTRSLQLCDGRRDYPVNHSASRDADTNRKGVQ
jgi:hypothetical protein